MWLYLQYDVKIAGRAAVHASVTLLLVTNARAIFNSRRNVDVNRAFAHHTRLAFALGAGIRDHAACSVAGRACARDAEQPLLITHLAAATAGGTGGRTFGPRRTTAPALVAGFVAPDFDFSLFAESGFFEGQCYVAASITAALRPAAPSSSADVHAEEVAEDVAKDIAEIGEVRGIKAAKPAG